MSNYIKSTNFATKDTLPSGNASKIVKGTELDNEFNAIASAVSSKADANSPALTGTPTAPTASVGTNTTQLATTAFVTESLQLLYPIGSIYINASSSTNPSSLLGFGTWIAFGAGRVLVGQDTSDTLFDVLEETGGSKDAIVVAHTHTATSTSTVTDPQHYHIYQTGYQGSVTSYGSNGNFGGGTPDDTSAIYHTSTESTGITVATSTSVASTGSSGTNANIQPYVVVKMWKRTA